MENQPKFKIQDIIFFVDWNLFRVSTGVVEKVSNGLSYQNSDFYYKVNGRFNLPEHFVFENKRVYTKIVNEDFQKSLRNTDYFKLLSSLL